MLRASYLLQSTNHTLDLIAETVGFKMVIISIELSNPLDDSTAIIHQFTQNKANQDKRGKI